jgi:hypothetical protein
MEDQTRTVDDDMPIDSWKDDIHADAAFESSLNNFLNSSNQDDLMDMEMDSEIAATDIQNVVEYLGPFKESGFPTEPDRGPGPGPDFAPLPDSIPNSDHIPYFGTDLGTELGPAGESDPDSIPNSDHIPNFGTETGPAGEPDRDSRPTADGLNNAYVRVLHTNGIHHIGMVTCSCLGEDKIPLDLVACRLLPASFIRIRTIFTTQLMDYFRLCNLELKASAYQFYQLIQRLTLPMGQSEMVNLYHEFRRMSRLWRWMKKLKWAGYGHNQQDHLKPVAGSLSIFCPTCPQPAINLPDDWKLDKNR